MGGGTKKPCRVCVELPQKELQVGKERRSRFERQPERKRERNNSNVFLGYCTRKTLRIESHIVPRRRRRRRRPLPPSSQQEHSQLFSSLPCLELFFLLSENNGTLLEKKTKQGKGEEDEDDEDAEEKGATSDDEGDEDDDAPKNTQARERDRGGELLAGMKLCTSRRALRG